MVKEKVLDLANKISFTKRGKANEIKPEDPEYLILEPLVTDEMAEVALYLEHIKGKSAEQVAALSGKSVEEVDRILSQLALDGVVFSTHKNGVDTYCLVIWIPGTMEMIVMNSANVKKYPQLGKAFRDHADHDNARFAGNVPVGMGLMRVIPVEAAIQAETRRVSYEEISKYLEEHEVFAVTDCECRVAARQQGVGCGHTIEDTCLSFGPLFSLTSSNFKRLRSLFSTRRNPAQ